MPVITWIAGAGVWFDFRLASSSATPFEGCTQAKAGVADVLLLLLPLT
jgi:hypothetical protein